MKDEVVARLARRPQQMRLGSLPTVGGDRLARFRIGTRFPDAVRYLGAFAGMLAVLCAALLPRPPIDASLTQSHASSYTEGAEGAARAKVFERIRYRGDEVMVAAYSGAPYTYASDLHIERQGAEMTVHDIDWRGKPFDDPIYYGVRVARWFPRSSFGAMLDFTHSKAYAPLDQQAKLSGSKDGQPLPPAAAIGDLFHHLEFTHGHNMLTLNLLRRLPSIGSLVSPYIGVGLGVALPHTEVQLKGTPGRTYAYEYAGPAAQLLIGIEIRVPRLSYFVEYKFTVAPYRVPLHNRDGDALPFDLWDQFKRWMSGGAPAAGWASTQLTSHQIIGGMGIRTVPALAAP